MRHRVDCRLRCLAAARTVVAHMPDLRPRVARCRRHSALATARKFDKGQLDWQDHFVGCHGAGVAAMTATPDEPACPPSGIDQIAEDEARLQKGNISERGAHLCLRAIGHQLKAEPDGVEDALQLIISQADKRMVVVAAAGIMAKILLDGVPRDQLRSPIRFPISFSLPGDIDPEDRDAWQQNVRAASTFVSAYATADPVAIEESIPLLCGEGTFEVLVVLVAAVARKLERHARWFTEALRCCDDQSDDPANQAVQERTFSD